MCNQLSSVGYDHDRNRDEFTMLRISSLTSSSDWILTARAISVKLSVTYVAVSFLRAQRGARSMACCIKPRFFS